MYKFDGVGTADHLKRPMDTLRPRSKSEGLVKKTLDFARVYSDADLHKTERNLEAEIRRESCIPPRDRKVARLRLKGERLLHSKFVLLTVVVLNLIDCALVLGELILDIHFIREFRTERDDISKQFIDTMQARYPQHLHGHSIDHMGLLFDQIYLANCQWNEKEDITVEIKAATPLLHVDETQRYERGAMTESKVDIHSSENEISYTMKEMTASKSDKVHPNNNTGHSASHKKHSSNHTDQSLNNTEHLADHTGPSENHMGHIANNTGHSANHTGHIANHTGHSTYYTGHSANHMEHVGNHTEHSANHTEHSANHTEHSANHTEHLHEDHHHEHSIWEHVAHGMHKASITILGILFVENLTKLVCMGKAFLIKKLEVFDALVVFISFVVDLVLLKGLMNLRVQDAVFILTFLLPWRVIRVVNSLIVAVLDHEHFRLKMLYQEKKAVTAELKILKAKEKGWDFHLKKIEHFCESEGIPKWKIRQHTAMGRKQSTITTMASLALNGFLKGMVTSPSDKVLFEKTLAQSSQEHQSLPMITESDNIDDDNDITIASHSDATEGDMFSITSNESENCDSFSGLVVIENVDENQKSKLPPGQGIVKNESRKSVTFMPKEIKPLINRQESFDESKDDDGSFTGWK